MSANAAVATRNADSFGAAGLTSSELKGICSNPFFETEGDAVRMVPRNGTPQGLDVGSGLLPVATIPLSEDRVGSISAGGLAPWQIKKIRDYIDTRIAHAIPLVQLAQQAGLSTSYFSTAFKATVGISPHSYVISCRVDHAKRRMLDSNDPLCEIALDCGLADQSHLSRVFRRVTGTTPSAWRRHAARMPAAVNLQ